MNKVFLNIVFFTITIFFLGCRSQWSTSKIDNSTVNFEIHSNMLIIEAYLNQKWGKFIIDTGASISILDYNQSKKYKFNYFLDAESRRLTGFGGRTKLMKASEVSFKLYGVSYDNFSFFASDLSSLNRIFAERNQKVLGILGSDFLKAHGAEIDYQLGKISLTPVF